MRAIHPRYVPVAICAATLLVGLFAAGCGGGGGSKATDTGSAATSRATGSMMLSVRWPDASRLIPRTAQAIRVVVTATANPSNACTVIIGSPGAGNATTRTIDGLVPTEYRIEASAAPNADGTGTAQAVGTSVVTVVAQTTVNAPRLELSTTVRSLRIRANRSLPLRISNEAIFATAHQRGRNRSSGFNRCVRTDVEWDFTPACRWDTGRRSQAVVCLCRRNDFRPSRQDCGL